MRTSLAVALIAALAVAADASACPDLRATEGRLGYGPRLGPERCEGMYQQPIAGEVLELLSFVQGSIVSGLDHSVTIVVPDTAPLDPGPIAIVARSLRPRVYYRMDAAVAPGASFRWPLEQVVIPAGLALADLGLIGTGSHKGINVFVPLRTSAETRPAKIILRAPVDFEAFQWRLLRGSGPPQWNTFGGTGNVVLAGDLIELTINDGINGMVSLDIAAKPIGAGYLRDAFNILAP